MTILSLLVVIHVLSAVIGIGPVFFYPVLFRKGQSGKELEYSVTMALKLDYFPKISGTIAVLSGLALALTGNYGSIYQLWLSGALAVYIIVQIIVIGTIVPRVKVLHRFLTGTSPQMEPGESFDQDRIRNAILQRFNVCCLLAIALFLLMILKPSGI